MRRKSAPAEGLGHRPSYAENEVLRTQDGKLKFPVLAKPFTKDQLAKALNYELSKDATVL